MKEEYLHHIWKYGFFEQSSLQTTKGEAIEIINRGIHNQHAGPDFLNAKVKIADVLWAGNIEIHLKSSDWLKHNHHLDAAYDNVILHVVLEEDKVIKSTKGRPFSTLELNVRIEQEHYAHYKRLINTKATIPCSNSIENVGELQVLSMKEKMFVNRLERKSQDLLSALQRTGNHFEQVFYESLAANFGFKVNAEPFEELAKRLALNTLRKHVDNPLQIEALLFGTSGFLTGDFSDEYPNTLKSEFEFLRAKYGIIPMQKQVWKFGRLRPSNFPSIRIAQFAELFIQSNGLKSISFAAEIDYLKKQFNIEANGYWTNRSQFDHPAQKRTKKLGKASIDNILINTISRFIFLKGHMNKDQASKEKSMRLLESIASEKNSIIENWEKLNIKSHHALDSQALIELNNEWCKKKRCLNCSIGVSLMKYEVV